jgi:hypothetical protein
MNDIQRMGIFRKLWLGIIWPYRQTRWLAGRMLFRMDVYNAIKEASLMEERFKEKKQEKYNWNYLRREEDKFFYVNGFDAGIEYVLKRQWRDNEKNS